MLELCREYDIKKFVLASTSSLYGKDNPIWPLMKGHYIILVDF